MLLTPPDVISQTLLAVPVWMLFELGVVFSGWFIKQRGEKSGENDTDTGYQPLSDTEMDAELDRIEAGEKE